MITKIFPPELPLGVLADEVCDGAALGVGDAEEIAAGALNINEYEPLAGTSPSATSV